MGTKSEVFVKLTLVFFISLLSFAVGTFVGKKYSDNQHKLASMEPGQHGDGHADRGIASEAEASGHGEKGEKTLTDDEIAKLAEEFVDDEHPTVAKAEAHGEPAEHTEPAHGAAPAHGAPAHSEPAHGTKEAAHDEHAAPAPAPEKKPAKVGHAEAAEKETRLPTSIPKDVSQYSIGKFTVQVASFAAEPEAKERAEELKSQGYSAFYIPANIKGKTWYRVSVGLFATEKEARQYKSEFAVKSKNDSAMVQKISQ